MAACLPRNPRRTFRSSVTSTDPSGPKGTKATWRITSLPGDATWASRNPSSENSTPIGGIRRGVNIDLIDIVRTSGRIISREIATDMSGRKPPDPCHSSIRSTVIFPVNPLNRIR